MQSSHISSAFDDIPKDECFNKVVQLFVLVCLSPYLLSLSHKPTCPATRFVILSFQHSIQTPPANCMIMQCYSMPAAIKICSQQWSNPLRWSSSCYNTNHCLPTYHHVPADKKVLMHGQPLLAALFPRHIQIPLNKIQASQCQHQDCVSLSAHRRFAENLWVMFNYKYS